MARSYVKVIIHTLFISVLLVGCATHREAKDLADYVNKGVLGIAEMEQKSLAQYGSVTGANYTTDDRVLETLRDQVIPLYRRFLEGLRTISPQTEEVQRLHKVYISGAQALYDGFREKMVGLQNKDGGIVRSANAKIEKGRVENERWRKELLVMADKYGLKEDKKEEKK